MSPSAAGAVSLVSAAATHEEDRAPERQLTFDEVYDQNFAFVWRSVRRMGVDASAIDDVVQEVFMVVHRRLKDFEARAQIRSWLFAILARVVQNHRRTLRRKPAQLGGNAGREEAEEMSSHEHDGPHESAARAEAVRTLHAVLETMPDERRAVFILAELEQMTVPEISFAVGANLNTVYSRLRVARAEFEEGVERALARDAWRMK